MKNTGIKREKERQEKKESELEEVIEEVWWEMRGIKNEDWYLSWVERGALKHLELNLLETGSNKYCCSSIIVHNEGKYLPA